MGESGERKSSQARVKVSKGGPNLAIQELIDKLENVIAQGSRLPLVDKVIVPMAEVLAVLDDLRMAVPDEVKEARRVLKERDYLLSEAQKESARLLADSQAALDARIRDSELVQRAEERAREVLKRAQTEAQGILAEAEGHVHAAKAGADQYALEVLHKLDIQLASFQNAVRKGIEVLERENAKVDHGI